MRALLLSAYAARSHRHWQHALRAMFPHWQWTELELPPRYFSWRVRGSPLYWSAAERAQLEASHDLLVATSMVDLATLRGLVPALARVPSLLYFHENQFDYPQHRQRHSLLEAQMVSLYSALAADRLAFNSRYNRDSFLAGLHALLQRMPDYVPSGVLEALAAKAGILPVPILAAPAEARDPWPARTGREPLRILWSARFEHDKGGERLHTLLGRLEAAGLDYRLALTGEQFRNSPPVFAAIAREFEHRLARFGYVEDEAEYRAWQRGADLVLSTALQEFQGLAVMEAVAAGCEPVLPDRLAYREYYPAACRYASHPDDPEQEARAAAAHILAAAHAPRRQVPDLSAFALDALRGEYARVLDALAGGAG